MSRKNDVCLSNALEYTLNHDIILTFEGIFLSKEDLFFCLDNLDDDFEDGGYYDSFEEFFHKLKEINVSFKDHDYVKQSNLNYSSDLIKKYLKLLVEFGFKIESKINLSICKKNKNEYLVEYIGYDFLPNENKGITTKNYEILSLACEKFEKIHNSFLKSI